MKQSFKSKRVGAALAAVLFVAAAAGLFCAARVYAAGVLKPSYLRCEYKVNPLGIDETAPRLSWIVTSDVRAAKQSAYQILVAGSREELDADKGGLWDSGKVSSDDTAQIVYAGKPLASRQSCYWKVRVWDSQGGVSGWSEPAMWSMGLLKESDWSAKWIGRDFELTKKQKLEEEMKKINSPSGKKAYFPSPHLRKEFDTKKGVRRATVYATALGFFMVYVNGTRAGNDYFTPGWTNYNKRVYYLTYDVTDSVKAGDRNAIGAILADGWYAGNVGSRGQRYYGKNLRLRAQLVIDYEDGTTQTVATDETWLLKDGPIREADMQGGETYDARLEMNGWNKPGFDDSKWKKVEVTESVPAVVQAYPGIPVRKTGEIKPLTMSEPQPGVFVFDLGQNFAGCERLKVRGGKAGDTIVMRFAEMLNADGTVYTTNLRTARVTDTYILKGSGEEVWEPNFTYHGYRYIEVKGYPGKPDLDTVTGIVMHSGLKETSTFSTSEPLLNRLFSNIIWGQRSNYMDVPTDCPQRDERLGWMGDAQVFVRTAAYNMDIAPFYTKWMVDIVDEQHEDGGYTDTAPAIAGRVTAAWGDAGVICPWTIYKVYGDTRMIEKNYDSMSRWIKFLKDRSPKYMSPPLGSYADWLNVNQPTDNGLISTAYFGRSLSVVADMADAIGKKADAESDRKTFEKVRKAFMNYYMLSGGKVSGESQTGYLLALRFALVSDKMRPLAAKNLVENIKSRDWSLATGFVGGGLLLPTLTDIGRTDVAYRLIENRKYPSWGYSIDQGATTIWERWNSYTLDKGFGDPGMNSFNHYAYGSVGEWMFGTMAGIDTDGAGFKKIMIHPRPGGGIKWTKASYDSIRGLIETKWEFDGDDLKLDVTVPANTAATVYVAAKSEGDVTEGGSSASKSQGVKFLRMEGNSAVYEVGSGKYSFVSKGGKTVADAENTFK